MAEQAKQKPVRWLNPASGYLTGYAYTLNPYIGCTFGCSYCYVRRMPLALFRGSPWGEWAEPKRFDDDSFRREWRRAIAKGDLTVFMSSVTDPSRPAERRTPHPPGLGGDGGGAAAIPPRADAESARAAGYRSPAEVRGAGTGQPDG